ncbi:MAG: hypothetical protein QOJ63_1745 [Solirubrobacteraceae bacterium]|nr:hypothetical protein [Solirubrobacteraceae bacterium]
MRATPFHDNALPLRFHHLAFLEDRGEVVVGRSDIDSYGVFPPDGAALVRELVAGLTPQAAAAWYAQTYSEPVDIDQFVATLRDLQLVCDEARDPAPTAAPVVRWQRLGRALFCVPAWACYAALVAAAILACAADGRMLPSTHNVFFSDYLVVVELSVLVGQLVLTAIHELAHVLAGRRLGIRSSVALSRRFYFVVLETNLDGLAVVPRAKRYLPILAGLLADLLAVCALTVTAYLTRTDGHVTLIGGFCLALAFTTLPRMAWQLYLFMRTDVYVLISTLTGCNDLDGCARGVLANKLNTLLGRHDRLRDEDLWHPADRRVARWYAPLLVGGYATMTVVGLAVGLPITWRFLSSAVERVAGPATETAHFWDSALLLALTALQVGAAVAIALRDRRRQRSTT